MSGGYIHINSRGVKFNYTRLIREVIETRTCTCVCTYVRMHGVYEWSQTQWNILLILLSVNDHYYSFPLFGLGPLNIAPRTKAVSLALGQDH